MEAPRRRGPSEVLKRGYSDEETAHIYELGRFFLENGDQRRAETIFVGLVEVAPDYAPAWLGLSCVHVHNKDYDAAIFSARQALRVDPRFAEAMLFLVACLLSTGDYTSAGTYLGEVGEMIEAKTADRPEVIRFYRAQLARFQARSA